jgi:hypothetical protein
LSQQPSEKNNTVHSQVQSRIWLFAYIGNYIKSTSPLFIEKLLDEDGDSGYNITENYRIKK